MPRVVVTRKLPEAVEDRLRRSSRSRSTPTTCPSPRPAGAALREADGLLCTVSDRLDAELIAAPGRRARIIANFGVGVNNIDLAAREAAGMVVGNTPGVLTDATADLAMALILAATRRMTETEALLRRGDWDGFRPTGRLGMGLQGARSASSAWAGSARRPPAAPRSASACGSSTTTAPPPAPSTSRPRPCLDRRGDGRGRRGVAAPARRRRPAVVISAELLAAMKPTAYLVNTARGDVVDEAALVEALAAGRSPAPGSTSTPRSRRCRQALSGSTTSPCCPTSVRHRWRPGPPWGCSPSTTWPRIFRGRPLPARVA